MFNGKFSRGGYQPVREHCQFPLVVLKELYAWLSFLVVLFLVKICYLLLNHIFYYIQDSKFHYKCTVLDIRFFIQALLELKASFFIGSVLSSFICSDLLFKFTLKWFLWSSFSWFRFVLIRLDIIKITFEFCLVIE